MKNKLHLSLQIKEFKPTDSTTNPSLVNAAARLPEYRSLVDDALAYAKKSGLTGKAQMDLLLDKVSHQPMEWTRPNHLAYYITGDNKPGQFNDFSEHDAMSGVHAVQPLGLNV